MEPVRHSFGILVASLALFACADSGAGLGIVGSRTWRADDKRVVVEVDLLAYETLGNNIGTYCTRFTFAGQTSPVEECRADLEDGDMRTVRAFSAGDLPEGTPIDFHVRHEATDLGRGFLAPR